MMRASIFLAPLLALGTSAFPFVMNDVFERQAGVPSTEAARALSRGRTNCGPTPCTGFNAAEQLVSTTGQHAYASPAANQIRGPCPGLNAAANHGYLYRSGITDIPNTIDGLTKAYGLSADAAGALAAYSILVTGDPLAGKWSIGGPLPPSLGTGLLGGGQGLSYAHNKYEGDASIGRKDAYLGNGDAHSLDIGRFKSAYEVGVTDGSDRYTLDKFAQNFAGKVQESISTNPYYFSAPFATFVVAPAAFNFVINLMSNHSAEEPSGYLDGEIFKAFFAVTGDYPNFTWLPGQERIPNNWYRRPLVNHAYTPNDIAADVAIGYAAYPDSARLGGNTNGVNTYAGVDPSDLTGGVFNFANLLNPNGNNLACFIGAASQAFIPDVATLPLNLLGPVTSLVNRFVNAFTGGLSCPAIATFSKELFDDYPGYTYSPTGPATNYRE
jgi:hypothetical protein